MIRSTDIVQFNELANRYLEASAPGYLYRHFRRNQSCEQLAQQFNSAQLVEEIDRLTTAEPRDMSNLVLAYACAIALTYRPLAEMSDALQRGPAHSPPWFRQIIDKYRATAISFSEPHILTVKPQIIAIVTSTASTTTATGK